MRLTDATLIADTPGDCSDKQEIEFGSLNLFVGGNNTGKTTVVRELAGAVFSSPPSGMRPRWFKRVGFRIDDPMAEIDAPFDHPEMMTGLKNLNTTEIREQLGAGSFGLGSPVANALDATRLASIANSGYYSHDPFEFQITLGETGRLDAVSEPFPAAWLKDLLAAGQARVMYCDSRLSSSFSTNISDIAAATSSPGDSIQALLCDENRLQGMVAEVREVFGIELGFDDLQQGDRQLRVCTEGQAPPDGTIAERALWWNRTAPPLHEQGDGVRAYTEILLALLDPNIKMLFIDEPEAFLHPPQKVAIGRLLASHAQYGKQIYVATHDASVVRGILEKDPEGLCVFHLSDNEGHHLAPFNALGLANATDPHASGPALHRVRMLNERVIESLFYQRTVLVESECDRLIYEYAAHTFRPDAALLCTFIGWSGNGDAFSLFQVMKRNSLPVVCVLDIDTLWSESHKLTLGDARLANERNAICDAIHASSLESTLKSQGLNGLSDVDLRTRIGSFLEKLKEKGIFLVPCGELESWFAREKAGKNELRKMINCIDRDGCPELASFLAEVMS